MNLKSLYKSERHNLRIISVTFGDIFTQWFRVNIIPSPACSCGAPIENAYHYFFERPLYTNQRNNLFSNLYGLQINDADVAVLTAGSHNHDENINRPIIQFAIQFIKDSQRFE